MGKYDSAILQLDDLIQQYKGDRFWQLPLMKNRL